MNIKATLDGETILTGKPVGGGGIAFWCLIELDDVYDFDETIQRLHVICEDKGIRFESRPSRRIVHLPPAYKITPNDVLA